MIKGQKKIEKIAKRFDLLHWWVESVAIEYFLCREYLVDENFWVFNFNMLREEQIKEIPNKKVVINGSILFHNIRPEDAKARILLGFIGTPMMPLGKDVIIPEGLVSRYSFQFQANPIDVWDPKLSFSLHAQILDEGRFYQWKIAEFSADYHPSPHKGWFKSDFLDLESLRKINDEIQVLRNEPVPANIQALERLRSRIHEKYDELETIRNTIRQKVLEYHQSQKYNFNMLETELPTKPPPVVTYLDSIQVSERKYKIRSHIEPLLYRSALKNLTEAKKIVEKRKTGEFEAVLIVDEIEASALCILCAASCLEAYINFIAQEYCPTIWDIFERMGFRQKWLFLPYVLGSSDCFEIDKQPFKNFDKLTTWRNQIIHYKHKLEKPKSTANRRRVSKAYWICNATNARIAVDTMRAMIERLSEKTLIPRSRWLYKSGEWLRDLL